MDNETEVQESETKVVTAPKKDHKKILFGVAIFTGLILVVIALTKKKKAAEEKPKKKELRTPVIVHVHNGKTSTPKKQKKNETADLEQGIVDEEETDEEENEGDENGTK